jgi:hypothetical protein
VNRSNGRYAITYKGPGVSGVWGYYATFDQADAEIEACASTVRDVHGPRVNVFVAELGTWRTAPVALPGDVRATP